MIYLIGFSILLIITLIVNKISPITISQTFKALSIMYMKYLQYSSRVSSFILLFYPFWVTRNPTRHNSVQKSFVCIVPSLFLACRTLKCVQRLKKNCDAMHSLQLPYKLGVSGVNNPFLYTFYARFLTHCAEWCCK